MVLIPTMFLGIGWWYITLHGILQDHLACIIDLLSYLPALVAVYYVGFTWCLRPALHSALNLHSSITLRVSSFELPPISSVPSFPSIRVSYACFLRWSFRQSIKYGSLVLLLVSTMSSYQCYFLPVFLIGPMVLLATNGPPSCSLPITSPSLLHDLVLWSLLPVFQSVLLALWLAFLQSLPLPVWLDYALLTSTCFLFVGGGFFVIWMWTYRVGLSLLDYARVYPPSGVSVVPDLVDGHWLLPPRRRKRRNGCRGHIGLRSCPHIAPVGSLFRHLGFLLVMGLMSSLLVGSTDSSSPTTSLPASATPLPPTPSWPAPSFDHLLGTRFSLPFATLSSSSVSYNIDDDIEDSTDGSFQAVEDASDQYVVNWIHLTDDMLSLSDSGYRFSFDFSPTVTLPVTQRLHPYWKRHHARVSALNDRIAALDIQARPVSWSSLTTDFLSSFCPTEAAHVLTARWMYSFTDEATVSIDLSRRFTYALPAYLYTIKLQHVPLIVDTGASVCISPTKSDFVPGSYKESNMKVRDLSGENKVAGEGLIRWAVRDVSGETRVLEVHGIHIPTAGVRLLSPQVIKKTHGIGGSIEDDGVLLSSKSGDVKIFAALETSSNLPVLKLENMPATSPTWLDSFQHLPDSPSAHLSVLSPSNVNLSPGEKELLLWHNRLSHTGVSKVQELCKARQWVRLSSSPVDSASTSPILPTKHPATIKTTTRNVKCGACCMAKQARRSTRGPRPSSDDPQLALKSRHLHPGDCISVDHYVSPVPARRRSGFGKSSPFIGGALYVDHASGHIFHHPQAKLDSDTTILGKQLLEDEASTVSVQVKHYHSDNGIFSSADFKGHCRSLGQTFSFCGVGAHHQNAVAERCIGTISRMARANLIHLMAHWPARCNLNLWALAMDYAVWVYNRTPRESIGGLSPLELWSSTRSDHKDLSRARVFGCPVYVLDPSLQDGKSIPKWNSRSRQGMFVGFSNEHSSLVPLVLNLQTGYISPQFHVIFDDAFHTVPSDLSPPDTIDDAFARLFDTPHRERYVDPNEVSEGARSSSTSFDPIDSVAPASEGVSPSAPEGGVPDVPILASDSEPVDEDALSPAIELYDFDSPSPVSDNDPPLRRSKRKRIVPSRLIAACTMLLPLGDEFYATWGQPALDAVNFNDQRTYHAKAKLTRESLDTKVYLRAPLSPSFSAFVAGFSESSLQLPWDGDEDHFTPSAFLYNADVARTNSLISRDISRLTEPGSFLVDCIQPHALAAKRGNDPDNPSYDEAMSGEHQSDYLKAAVLELKTLQEDLKCWTLVRRTANMNVLPSTWAFKCKRFPDGRIKKFKARFCARGDRQVEGVDFFETWSPVVQWQTVRLMLVLSSMLDLKSAQADITAAFVHADLPESEQVYVHQPRGFKVNMNDGHEYVLKLNKTLYGLKQAPRHFFQYLTRHLEKHGVMQSNCDPCLFIGPNIIVIVYVDDILMYARDERIIDSLIGKLKKDNIWIRKEGSTEGFLGVDISPRRPDGSFTLLQTGLTKRVIEALGLHADWTGAKETPADVVALPRDKDGTPADPLVNYSSVVGMLLYLAGHTRPDIAFAVHQCARYTFKPTTRHVTALKRIGRYLKGTQNEGLIMKPSSTVHVDCYPDADFAGLYSKEDAQDPHCVRSRTGYVISVANCPVLWKSKLQTEIALSTMEAEYVALSTACKDLFPLLDLVKELSSACGLQVRKDTNLHVKVHEDNVGALTLGRLEPRRITPRSKHYALKYHWFREHIGPRNIQLVKIDTKEQLGDIFTKGLSPVPFKHLRRKLMGW